MRPMQTDQIEYGRPQRAPRIKGSVRVIDGYPAGYVAQLARPLRRPGAGRARVHTTGAGGRSVWRRAPRPRRGAGAPGHGLPAARAP